MKFPVSSLKPGAKVMGTTIAELGNRNRPLDMIVYKKDGKDYLLMANTQPRRDEDRDRRVRDGRWHHGQGSTPKPAASASSPITTLKGVEQLDLLDAQRAIVLARRTAARSRCRRWRCRRFRTHPGEERGRSVPRRTFPPNENLNRDADFQLRAVPAHVGLPGICRLRCSLGRGMQQGSRRSSHPARFPGCSGRSDGPAVRHGVSPCRVYQDRSGMAGTVTGVGEGKRRWSIRAACFR